MPVTVKRERSDQRRHHRVTAPLFVTALGHRHRAADWSLGGLRLDDVAGEMPAAGTDIELKVELPFQGFEVAFDAVATVVRCDADRRTLALMFKELGEREAELMKHFIDELVRGKMSPIADTIQRIDVPVTPASTAPDANPIAKVPVHRWPMRTMAFTAFYFIAGFIVFGYALVLVWTNFLRMEVDTAVISAPVEAVRAQIDGRVKWGKYRAGDKVPAGALVLHVLDHELEKEIDFADLDIAQKKAQVASLRMQLKEELERIVAFATVDQKNVEQLSLDLASLQASAKAAQSHYERLNVLYKQGFTTQTLVETAEKQMIAARQAAEAKAVELASRKTLVEQNSGRRLYNGQTFIGDRAKVEAQLHQLEQEQAIAERKLKTLEAHRERLAVVSPFAGVLTELTRVDGAMVRKGDTIAVLEQPEAREVTAYLRQDEVLKVGLYDQATIYLPALGETRRGRIMAIDRTAGFVNEQNSTYTWRGPRDRSARVTLAFEDKGSETGRSYRSGTPAIVLFKTRTSNYVLNDLSKRLDFIFGGRPVPRRSERVEPRPSVEKVPSPPALRQRTPERSALETEISSAEAALRAADRTLGKTPGKLPSVSTSPEPKAPATLAPSVLKAPAIARPPSPSALNLARAAGMPPDIAFALSRPGLEPSNVAINAEPEVPLAAVLKAAVPVDIAFALTQTQQQVTPPRAARRPVEKQKAKPPKRRAPALAAQPQERRQRLVVPLRMSQRAVGT
ncbi:MAG: HlyD family efflux transporter periplasmic adaptor subunit [Hyphomicrobiaceae bacterium]|nr:MAG: HlyD family efflux transporter periplasmic adaptor subunit [Hyphomicrobiaceae bacterium]